MADLRAELAELVTEWISAAQDCREMAGVAIGRRQAVVYTECARKLHKALVSDAERTRDELLELLLQLGFDMEDDEAQRILDLTDAGMALPPDLHRRAVEFCAEVDEAADEMRRRYLAMPWWRRVLFRWGWR